MVNRSSVSPAIHSLNKVKTLVKAGKDSCCKESVHIRLQKGECICFISNGRILT